MNSQFRNSNFGFILYTAIVTIIVLATAFVIWYMTVGYRVGTFGPGTRLGSVYIGGLTEEEVVPLMDDRIDYWYNDDTIVFELKYQDYTYEFDRKLLLFDLDLSTYNLKDGQTNTLVAYYQPEDLENIRSEISSLPYLQGVINNIDLNGLITDILHDASLMTSYSVKNVEDYIVDMDAQTEVLSTADFTVPEGVQINNVLSAIDTLFPDGQIPINSKELFSSIDVFGSELNDQEMTMLSSAILEDILSTNFIINETHYEPDIDFSIYTVADYPYYGRNTVINRIVNEDFSFYNPNEFSYYLTIEKIDDFNGQVILHGVPFVNTIQVNINKTEIPYITQSTSNVDLLQNGYNGVVVEVQRVITDVYGNKLKDDVIVFEFYPPIKEIVFEP